MGKYDKNENALKKIIKYSDELAATTLLFGRDYEEFQRNVIYRNACSMCIFQIGEMTTRFTTEFKDNHTTIPWHSIKKMRNLFAHDYSNIDIKETWNIIIVDVPELKDFCQKTLKNDFDGY